MRWQPLPEYADRLSNVTVTAKSEMADYPLERSCSVIHTDTELSCTIDTLEANFEYAVQAKACAPKDGVYPSICSDNSLPETFETLAPRKCNVWRS